MSAAPVITGHEGTGVGLGIREIWEPGPRHQLRVGGTVSFRGYQRGWADWTLLLGPSQLAVESMYQWRPKEDFYGFGNQSLREQRTNYALRQFWAGLRWEVELHRTARFGAAFRHALITTGSGKNDDVSSVETIFGTPPGYRERLVLDTAGVYGRLDSGGDAYYLGGSVSGEASYNHASGANDPRFVFTRISGEGRAPIWAGRTEVALSLSAAEARTRAGSGPIPFYLLPRLGGSEGLRGFRVDRFHAPATVLATLEVRQRLHENFDGVFFFDQGHVAERIGTLRLGIGHRGYGAGIRLHSHGRKLMGLFVGHSREGYHFHFLFGAPRNYPPASPLR